MNEFNPHENFFSPILFKTYWYLPTGFNKKLERNTLKSIISTIDSYYSIPFGPGFSKQHFFSEVLKNARVHGGNLEEKPTYCGIFLNKEKICFGCCDGGNYFKREDIKEIWESKSDLKEMRHKTLDSETGFGFGYDMLKRTQDTRIFVDNVLGILYFTKDL